MHDDVILSKYSTTSISKREMSLDPTFLDIWIFMIYIESRDQSDKYSVMATFFIYEYSWYISSHGN